jgi:fatty-acyl-CoA synthase
MRSTNGIVANQRRAHRPQRQAAAGVSSHLLRTERQLTNDLLSIVPSGSLQSSLILLRANTSVRERPDRLALALGAASPYRNSMLAAVAAAAARYPYAVAVATADHSVTYRELWRGSNALARGLSEGGVGPKDRVGILCRNSPMFVHALLGVAKLGADIVLLNTAMGPAQLAEVIAGEKLMTVLHDDDFGAALSPIDGVWAVGATQIQAMLHSHPKMWLAPPRRDSRLVILTSGTTGRPKGATRSSRSSSVDGIAALLHLVPYRLRDTTVIAAPFFHGWGLGNLLIGLGLSATVLTAPEFDAAHTLSLVSEHRARALVVVPTMLQRICALPPTHLARADTDNLRIIASSGSALPGRLATGVLNRFGPVLYNVYGSTEVAVATIATPADLRRAPTTAGRRALGVRVEILDGHGQSAANATVGRIFVASSARFDGYTNGHSKEVLNGLMSTGDMGYFDEHGRLFVVGREDDMIVSGGENVYPSEIEELLSSDERIAEAAVVGIDDDRFGQALKAVIVVAPNRHVDVQELKELIARQLAKFKVPRIFEFVDALPRNATGKILRRQLI